MNSSQDLVHKNALEAREQLKYFNAVLNSKKIPSITRITEVALQGNGASPGVDRMPASSFRQIHGYYDKIIECVAGFIAAIEDNPIFESVDFPEIPELGSDHLENLSILHKYCVDANVLLQPLVDEALGVSLNNQLTSIVRDKKREQGKGFYYEFTDGDLKRVQELINELRTQITGSELFDENHRSRLLAKLEKLQSELHKRVSSLDSFWGMLGDAGVALGKFGNDAKPLVDRVKEISQITWRTQAHAEELPTDSNNPLLGSAKKIENQSEES